MASKSCATCGQIKDQEAYAYRNKLLGRRWGTCKACQSQQRADWYQKNKETHKANTYENKKRTIAEAQQYIWNHLSEHPCIDCGETDPVVLEFDHIRGNKKKAVGDLARQGYSISAIQMEISKCVVRCANCHRRKTHKERGWFRG